jgi:hypothetical protein
MLAPVPSRVEGGPVRRPFILAALVLGIGGAPANASQLLGRNATDVKLAVNGKGEALVTYTSGGTLTHVLAWGAVNAVTPTPDGEQVAFRLDYSGGYAKYRRSYWRTFGAACGHYAGPELADLVAVCSAPDGSNWSLQAWQRGLPDYGVVPSPSQSAVELHLSHWTGALPVLTVRTDWAYRTFNHLYGSFVYRGAGVHGYRSTRSGLPLDTFGRNLYVDTYDSAYGRGWRRENSFLTHNPNGTFCYGFYPHGSHSVGKGTRYRATVVGPGVTPDIAWEGPAPASYDPTTEAAARLEQRKSFTDRACVAAQATGPG